MGRRDFRHRESKKAKKDSRKSPSLDVLATPANVEVIKKARKKGAEEEA